MTAESMPNNEWMRAQPTAMSLTPFDRSVIKTADNSLFTETRTYTFGDNSVEFTLVQIHLAVITFFCATVAPFGGFFAFGLKRALRAEDLGKTMARGGVIERIDCIIVTGFFLLIYIRQIVYSQEMTMGKVKDLINNLSPAMKQELLTRMEASFSTA